MIREGLFALMLATLAACSTASSPKLDGGTGSGKDASSTDDDAPTSDVDGGIDAFVIDGPPGAHRHTITVDGIDDFATEEKFATTSVAYGAAVTWDDQFVYVGYSGPDLDPGALDTQTKWLFVYVDTDPGMGNGAAQSQTYRTQTANFPTGFAAELYGRWKCDGTFHSIEKHDGGGAWSASATAMQAARAGTFVELAIPRSLFGTADKVGLVTWMINEKENFEGTFAGLYTNNFTDGYAMTLPLTKYVLVDFASPRGPNDPQNQRP